MKQETCLRSVAMADLISRKFSQNAARLFALIEQESKSVTFAMALRRLGMPYGDIGRARAELIEAGMIEVERAEPFGMVAAGGAK